MQRLPIVFSSPGVKTLEAQSQAFFDTTGSSTMSNITTQSVLGKASTTKGTFFRSTTVSTSIAADPAIIWTLLTTASDFPRWNSTVRSIEGTIALGEKIVLKSILDAKRSFKLKVKEFEKEKRMVWGDAQGSRVYTLSSGDNGEVVFTMTERIGGPLFPLFANMIPSFDESFEIFARDLKNEAEQIMSTK